MWLSLVVFAMVYSRNASFCQDIVEVGNLLLVLFPHPPLTDSNIAKSKKDVRDCPRERHKEASLLLVCLGCKTPPLRIFQAHKNNSVKFESFAFVNCHCRDNIYSNNVVYCVSHTCSVGKCVLQKSQIAGLTQPVSFATV